MKFEHNCLVGTLEANFLESTNIRNVLFRARLFFFSTVITCAACFMLFEFIFKVSCTLIKEGLPVGVLGRSWSSPWRSSSPRTWWRFLQDPPATIISVISATILAMMLLPGNVNTTPSPSRHINDPNWIKHKSKKCKKYSRCYFPNDGFENWTRLPFLSPLFHINWARPENWTSFPWSRNWVNFKCTFKEDWPLIFSSYLETFVAKNPANK